MRWWPRRRRGTHHWVDRQFAADPELVVLKHPVGLAGLQEAELLGPGEHVPRGVVGQFDQVDVLALHACLGEGGLDGSGNLAGRGGPKVFGHHVLRNRGDGWTGRRTGRWQWRSRPLRPAGRPVVGPPPRTRGSPQQRRPRRHRSPAGAGGRTRSGGEYGAHRARGPVARQRVPGAVLVHQHRCLA